MTDEVAEITMSYEGLVEAGREARKQIDGHQWTEGDLAMDVEALPPNERPRDPETGEFLADQNQALKRYATDIDMSYGTLQNYRRVSDAWPRSARADGVGHKVHEVLATQPDRFDLIHEGMSVREARTLVRKRNAASVHEPGWFELLGEVSDTLTRASKQLDRAEGAISRKPKEALLANAARYAEQADDIADRLRQIAEWNR